jgi:hypothetical protein
VNTRQNPNPMKKIFVSLLVVLASCNLAAVDEEKAKAVAEKMMTDMKNEDYSKMDSYYTADSNESEPLDKKIEKFKKLKDVMGPVQSFEFISSKTDPTDTHGGPKIELKYKLVCSKVTVTHTLIIINDEGTHKITFQSFEN